MNGSSQEIHVIGIDASGFQSLSFPLQELILSAERIAAPSRILNSLPKWWASLNKNNPTPELVSSDKTSELISLLDKKDKKTILLASGDPLWFGIGRLLVEKIPKERLFFYPSPTSLQLAFARLGRPWQDASWISLHGRDPIPLAKRLQQRPNSLIILTEPKREGAQEVQTFLRSSGLERSYEFWIFERLGHPKERIIKVQPNQDLPKDLNPLHLVALIKQENQISDKEALPLFGIDDGVFKQYHDRPGLMTKKEVRIKLLADLELPEKGVLWDICAGVGSIGLEALRIRPQLKLLSVDQRVGSKELIKINASRLGVKPTAIYESEALRILRNKSLPSSLSSPDRVLLGGGGSSRVAILQEVLQYLNPGGIVVIPLSTLQAIPKMEEIFNSIDCLLSISQLQSYRGVPLSDGTRFTPMNPVFIIKSQLK